MNPNQPVQPAPGMPMQQPQVVGATTPATAGTNVEAPSSTQATLLISEIRDSMVIMKDGSFRAVIACKSINFDLMSETEREGVEYSYQNFLNSLHFTTQILIRSQRVDIGPYIERLAEIRRGQDNMLLGVLMDDYINFIDILSQEANIMDKSFFIVIPYYTSIDAEKLVEQTKNLFKSFSKNKGPAITKIDRATYDKASSEMNNRIESVIAGLFQIGIQSVRLNTKELGELYYNFNNPDTAVREPLGDFSKVAGLYVKKGEPEVSNG
jgi:type IV secretory pathway VirB4 component